MSCVQLTDAQKKKNIYKHTKGGRSKAMEFSHIMRNTRFDLTRKKVICDTTTTEPTNPTEIEQWLPIGKLVASDINNGDLFGTSVSIYDDCVLICAQNKSTTSSFNGVVYLFKKNQTDYGIKNGSNYNENYRLIPSDVLNNDMFGSSVDVFQDYIIIGAKYKEITGYSASGIVYVYKKNINGSYGNQIGTTTSYTQNYKLIASDLENNDEFGTSVAIYDNYIVVGASKKNSLGKSDSGAVYIYKKNTLNGTYGNLSGSNYIQNYKLIASDSDISDYFGTSVAIYDNYIVVGASDENSLGKSNNGAAYIYKKNTSNDTYGILSGSNYIENYKLIASDLNNDRYFGTSVSIHENYILVGNYVYIKNDIDGSFGDLSGSVYVENFKLFNSDLNTLDLRLVDSKIHNNYVLIGEKTQSESGYSNNGAAYIYKRNINSNLYGDLSGTKYIQNYKLLARDITNGDSFGCSVDIHGDYALIGASDEDSPGYNLSGSAYLFKKIISTEPIVPPAQTNNLYLIGGLLNNGFENTIYKYVSPTWTTIPQHLTISRAGFSTVIYDKTIYIIGGLTDNNVFLNDIEMFDGISCTTNPRTMNQGRSFHASVLYNGYIYVTGGASSLNSSISSVEYYNISYPLHPVWTNTNNMVNPRNRHSAVVYDNKIYVMGGETSINTDSNSFEVFNETTNTWTLGTTTMSTTRSQHASVVYDGKIYTIGGKSHGFGYLKSVDVFDGSSWSLSSAELSNTRTKHSAVVYDNKIYVIGGIVDGVQSDTIEVFDGNSWTLLTTVIPQPLYLFGVAIYNK